MPDKEWQQVEVESKLVVPFKYIDDTPGGRNLGRAEFQVCLHYFRGKLRDYYVYPCQQHDADTFWHYVGNISEWSGFGFSAYEGLDDAKVWKVDWCEEHKGPTLLVYVPDHARFLRLDEYGVSFLRTEW
jgi:hypothetical protein